MRDYRDAKTMAKGLRRSLTELGTELTHSQSLELIAQAFGFDNWNILAAKIEAARLRAEEDRASAAAAGDPAAGKTLCCSFCGKSQHVVAKLIAGPGVLICDECVGRCTDILREGAAIWSVLTLLAKGEKSGSDAYPAALEHVRGHPTERIVRYMEQSREYVEHNRGIMRQIDRLIERPDAPPTQDELLASSRFGHLNGKTTDELRAMREEARRALVRCETALAIGTRVLIERQP